MIIKLKTLNDGAICEGLVVRESWRFYEDISQLHYTIYDNDVALLEEEKKWPTPQEVQTIIYKEGVEGIRPMLFASFYSESLGDVHLFCNTTCYLLNDQGKTIERLI